MNDNGLRLNRTSTELPEPLKKVVDGVQVAGEVAGGLGGGVVGAPIALAAKGIAALSGKSSSEGDAIAERVLSGSIKIGRAFGQLMPTAVLSLPFIAIYRFSKRS